MGRKTSPPHVRACEPNGDPLLPRNFEFDGRPIAGFSRTVDAPAQDPFACLKVSMLVKSVDEPAGVGQDCGFPFCAAAGSVQRA
jgi:hypothetical protein